VATVDTFYDRTADARYEAGRQLITRLPVSH